jgi:uncharacterized protein (DUF1330 family)
MVIHCHKVFIEQDAGSIKLRACHGPSIPTMEATQMSVYYIAEHIITDSVKFEEYRVKVAPMIASYGGRYITKAGSHKFPENPHWRPERVVIIEFPNMERLNAWYTSTEYQPLMALRKESTDEKDMVITVEGM